MIILENVKRFIDQLEKPTISKVWRIINLLEIFQYQLSMPYSKQIERHLCELRIRGKQEVRIIYTFQNKQAVLFYGFIKKSQKISRNELNAIYNKYSTLDQYN